MALFTSTYANLRGGAMPQPGRRRKPATMPVIGTLLGVLGSVAASVLGGLLTAGAWFATEEGTRQGLATSGAVLLYLTVPLLIFGACCGDRAEKHYLQRQAQRTRDEDDEQ